MLRNCPACKHQVSTHAKTCPNCGKPMFKGISGGLLFLIIVAAIVSAFLLVSLQVLGFLPR